MRQLCEWYDVEVEYEDGLEGIGGVEKEDCAVGGKV